MADDRPIFRSLIAPADCALILIGGPGIAESDGTGDMGEPLAALLEAAERHGVPALLLAREKGARASGRCPVLSYRPINPLADPDVRRALAVFGRPRLVIGGDHAETALTFFVLSALEEGYDVYLLRELCLGACALLAETAAARMMQAGAVPISVPQVVTEWRCMLPLAV